MSEDPKIHFTIGPVQGFVAQARRTRDLWSGSFLLSYLAGCAIDCILDEMRGNGHVLVPDTSKDPILERIKLVRLKGEDITGEGPMIGSLPNRFEATAPDPEGAAAAASIAVKGAWKKIANAVYKKYVEEIVTSGLDTKAIWDRQVDSFWEVSWTVSPNIDSMNYRKNWRSHMPPAEGGDHCTIMGDLQEISGFVRSRQKDRLKQEDRLKQDAFWKLLRSRTGGMDLREGERLCSIALIKRMFPDVSKESIGWKVDAENWPSTAYVAAIPWLELAEKSSTDLCSEYARMVLAAAPGSKRRGISDKMGLSGNVKTISFLNLDGNFYFRGAIDSCDRTPLEGTPRDGDCKEEHLKVRQARDGLKGKLNELIDKTGTSPSSFYGMLIMDGDNMGTLIREKGGSVSGALGKFTESVHRIVKENNGITIYAGGDDVLAMIPAEKAIGCSLKLSDSYMVSFRDIPDPRATISAGLVFSQYRVPLSVVLHEAHYLLDDVAKDQNGRGSLAVSVLKPGGKHCQWTTTWDCLKVSDGKILREDLIPALKGDRQFSSRFFYSIREILTALSGDLSEKPGSYVHLADGMEPVGLLAAKYMMSMERTENPVSRKDAEDRMKALLRLCYRSRRDKDGKAMLPEENCLSTDGAMLLKFLSQSGEEVE